ncbi:MAG: ABC transporter permease [Saccharofermentans sp.]|nr:ABC transporter permease [Saccharofermentans sp.]
MRTINSWFKILIKKTLLNRAFIALLILIPLLCIGLGKFGSLSTEKHTEIIYICARSHDEVSDNFIANLEGEYDGYSFVYEEDEDKILHDVRNHTALCGYILEKNQTERIAKGKLQGNIILVERIGNLQTDIVNEIVFSEYYRQYTRYYTPIAIGEGDEDLFKANFDEHTSETLLNYSIKKIQPDLRETNAVNRSAHNIIGVIMCLFGMLIISDFISEKERGLLYPVMPKNRFIFRIVYFTVPIIMLTPFALIGSLIQEANNGILKELISILLYDILLIVLCVACSYIIKKRQTIMGMIPILTILYIVICPVFIDLASYLPIIAILRYLCPPFYYML